ncbi:MAG: ArsA-related P-loop ATPase [Pseudomonadota bacterium]|nr:ArsA-related P-loop ATPase [Pseudomonadota bacterium]
MAPSFGNLDLLVEKQRLIVCVGSGGVGKTTSAAAIGLRAAMRGRRVLVLTIDPARRLANSLGLTEFGNTEVRIDLGERASGELWAMMLDAPSTLDDVIRRVAKDDVTREAIFANKIYRHMAGSFSGSQEYMATERLYDVYGSDRYDLIVLDTPPVKNALDFLESPGRLVRFLDRQIMKWFLTPYEEEKVFGKRFLMGTSSVVYRLLGHIFGREFLDELSVFFALFRDLYDGFRERHEAVGRLFAATTTSFLVVSAPTEPSVDVARFFLDELRTRKLPVGGVVVNQVHMATTAVPDVDALLGPGARALDAATSGPLLARLGAAHRRLRELAALEAARVEELRRASGVATWLRVIPRHPEEVHDLEGLLRLHRDLFDTPS